MKPEWKDSLNLWIRALERDFYEPLGEISLVHGQPLLRCQLHALVEPLDPVVLRHVDLSALKPSYRVI